MSEAELIEVALMAWGNMVAVLAVALTLLRGYLIVAFMAGASLLRQQVLIVNSIYIGFSIFLLGGMWAFSEAATDMEILAFEMTTQRNFAPKSWLAYGIIGFYGISLLASLRFMWDIRHPKNE